jgi:hypothetical protein
VNAYNANTIALVLTRYPDLASIKDLGGWITSPWKQRFVELLGATRSLDDDRARAHPRRRRQGRAAGALRAQLRVDWCPALRPEAYRGDALDAQLADQTDASSPTARATGTTPARGARGVADLRMVRQGLRARRRLGREVPGAARRGAGRRCRGPAKIAAAALPSTFLDYDWRLNDAGAQA